jgi:SpoVK/Ycf46/Vps4 family AAA+-type ATPase
MPSTPPKNTRDPQERLRIIMDSSTPLVIMETVEELRALTVVRLAAAELQLPVFEWSIADGLFKSGTEDLDHRQLENTNAAFAAANLPPIKVVTGADQFQASSAPPPIYNTKEAAAVLEHLQCLTIEAVFVLKDLHRHLGDAVVVRRLRQVTQVFSQDRRTLVLTAPAIEVPAELQHEVEYVDLPLPDKSRLQEIVEYEFDRLGKTRKLQRKLDAAQSQALVANLAGLTEEEAERAVGQAIVGHYGLLPDAVKDVLDAKRDMLRRSGALEFIEQSETLSALGGMENLKMWLKKRRSGFDENARAAGLEPPKGVLIMGVQGCGKSMCARAIAGEWNLPLVKFDCSAVFDKYIGETEKRVKRLFMVAEQLAPCVLWIDELEKVFAGCGPDSASSDAGTSSRLLGAFLSWMQDHKAPVFIAATSNNVSVLPPELIRKGRFDELFFVDLPIAIERRAILSIQLTKRRADPAKFDLDQLVAASAGYSGAEIEGALQSAMYASFTDRQPLSTELVRTALADSVPLSATRAEEITALRDWAKNRAVPATKAQSASAAQ